jgi:hypothetical protein
MFKRRVLRGDARCGLPFNPSAAQVGAIRGRPLLLPYGTQGGGKWAAWPRISRRLKPLPLLTSRQA